MPKKRSRRTTFIPETFIPELPLVIDEWMYRQHVFEFEAGGGIPFDPANPPEGPLRHDWERLVQMRKVRLDVERGAQMDPAKRIAWHPIADAYYTQGRRDGETVMETAKRASGPCGRDWRTVYDYFGKRFGKRRKRTRA